MLSESEENIEKLQLKIGRMQCSFCTNTIRQALNRLKGVYNVSVSLAHEEALIQFNPNQISHIKIKDTLTSLGFTIRDPNKIRTFEEEEHELQRERNRLFFASSLTLIAFFFMLLMWVGFRYSWAKWAMFLLAIFTMFVPGWYIKKMAWASIRRGILNQHVLLEFAAFGGLIGGIYGLFFQPWPTIDFFAVSIFVTSYHVLSGYVSLLVRTKSSLAIKKLMELQPTTARIIKEDGTEEEVPIEQVKKESLVRVRSGENIPVDGVVVKGISTVDQSLITGESIPVIKKEGGEVIGGSLNQQGTLIIKVSKVGNETFLQQISQHIQEARALKPGIVILIDKVLKYFVWIVISAAILAFLFWTLGFWLIFREIDLKRAIFATLSVLVMGYPCALGMATPLALIRGGGIAAENGILMRSGEAFQSFKDVDKMILDKTGTLTIGKPEVVKVIIFGQYTELNFLSIAASIEIGSQHPLAKSIVDYALTTNVEFLEVVNFKEITGFGVQGKIKNDIILVGNSRLMEDNDINISSSYELIKKYEEQGLSAIFIANNKELIGLIIVGDTLKKEARNAINAIKSLGIEPVMITGDNWLVAKAIANDLGIKEILAEVLPNEKADKIRELQEQGHKVAMVGDGINDAPALMQADVGIAIGTGTDIAIESSDIIIVRDDLMAIIDAYHISKSSYKKTTQNIILAFGFNGIGVATAVSGLVHPIWAMIAMALSVSSILANSFGGKLLKKVKNAK